MSRRVRLPILCAGVLVVSLAATAQKARKTVSSAAGPAAIERATAAFRQGSAEFQNGNLKAARTSFETAVRLAPRVSAAHSALGAVLFLLGNATAAVRELQSALAIDPHDALALANLAAAQASLQQYTAATQSVTTLRALNPDFDHGLSPELAVPIAAALSQTGDPAAAEVLLTNAAPTPADAGLMDALGSVQAQQGHFDTAEASYQAAIRARPSLAQAHFHLGSVYLEMQRPQPALAELTTAHTLAPAETSYTVQLAQAQLLTGQEAQAAQILRTTLATLPPADPQRGELQYRLALALQSQGDPAAALPFFAAAVRARTQVAEILINAGLAYVQTGDAPTGTALYLRALALSPANATLHEDLGVAYLQQNNLNDALTQFRAGLALDPESPQLHYDLALALKLKDDIAAAIPEFERAQTLSPDLPDPPYTLGIIYMQQGRFAEAAGSLERALALRPTNGDAWATLGSVYRELNQPAKAEPALRRAIELLPEQPSPHITLASVLAAQGRKQEAAEQRKLGADLTRIAVSRQKATFALESGRALLKRGQIAEAIAQLQTAVAADPAFAPPHSALAEALERVGRKAEAAEERREAASLTSAQTPVP